MSASETSKPKKAPTARSPKSRRAKAEASGPSASTEPLSVRWNVHELPSSQHKAGLAGLALWVQYLNRFPDRPGVCELAHLDDSILELRVDRAGMQYLFDRVYAADREEVERDKKFQKKLANGTKVDVEPTAVRERTEQDKKGTPKVKTVYVYPQTIPHGGLVDDWDESETKIWRKLWRDLVWSILRGIPATREPYDARADQRSCADGHEAWEELASAGDDGVKLPSTYYLGAQAKSAENVSFRDRARNRFLLHFWPFAVPVYVPVAIDRDGQREFTGFVLVVPDVVDLEEFVANWETLVRGRSPDVAGCRPRDALVDVAAEAGLDVSARVFALIERGSVKTAPWMGAVDVFHVQKDGDNIRMRSVGRVELKRDWVGQYQRARVDYWSPVFRRQVILNILEGRGERWWNGFGRLCSTMPEARTIQDKAFRHDCREALKEVEMSEQAEVEEERSLEQVIFKVTRAYVYGRLRSKYDLDWSGSKGDDAARGAYNEKKDKIAREAFLAVRSRTGADFVAYFTGTLCSVNQRIGQQGYLLIADAFRDEAELERVRTLTLLALSAA